MDMKTKDVFQVSVADGDTMADIRMMIAVNNCTMGLTHFRIFFKTSFMWWSPNPENQKNIVCENGLGGSR